MLLSIIIPAYNCENTIKKAVSSVLTQGFSDCELIIINDGSTDRTIDRANELLEKYDNVISMETSNGGPAKARNAGISVASGDYILFLDSDDDFRPGAFETISENLSHIDMLIFGFKQKFFGRAKDKIYSYDGHADIDILYRTDLLNQVWNKAYRRAFLLDNKITFEDYKYGEDRIFNGRCLERNPVISVIPDVLYNYNMLSGTSLVTRYSPDKFAACKEIYLMYSSLCTNKQNANYMYLKNILSCLTVLYADNCNLTNEEKNAEAKSILSDETVKQAMSEEQDSLTTEIIRRIINTGNADINLKFAKAVTICKEKLPGVFEKFK